MFGRNRERRERLEAQQRWEAWSAAHVEPPLEPDHQAPGSVPVVDDFLPPDLRLPTREELAGMLMAHDSPLVLDGEVRACSECGAYRKWIVASTNDGVWLRCPAGHQQVEPRLDAAWFNTISGPITAQHASYEECLRFLGH
ncbi:hypothetical protein [Streptomyces sp. NBC_01276]|uniref:hypothetical protein n=1 Tax=Streptomyces sp. NBC_01276 TaxID=2903808 RepID=UPI00352E7534